MQLTGLTGEVGGLPPPVITASSIAFPFTALLLPPAPPPALPSPREGLLLLLPLPLPLPLLAAAPAAAHGVDSGVWYLHW
jgi:hypothetical protein